MKSMGSIIQLLSFYSKLSEIQVQLILIEVGLKFYFYILEAYVLTSSKKEILPPVYLQKIKQDIRVLEDEYFRFYR
jgi:hypothetical protein